MFGRRKNPPAVEPEPPAELTGVLLSLVEDGAVDADRVNRAWPVLDAVWADVQGPRPLVVDVDGEYGWEVDETTAEEHLSELLTDATAVMRDRGVEVTFGEVVRTDDRITAVVDGATVVLTFADQPGRPVLNATMGVLVALNAVAQRAGSQRRWYFAPISDRMGPGLFLTAEQAAGVDAETARDADGLSVLGEPERFIG